MHEYEVAQGWSESCARDAVQATQAPASSYRCLKQRHVPLAGRRKIAKDIRRVVGTENLEITMIDCKPSIDDLHDFDAPFTQREGGWFTVSMQTLATLDL